MQKSPRAQKFFILLKIAGICLIALVLAVPLGMVQSLIGERAAAKEGVVRDIAQTAADVQRLTLPVIVVPYTRKWVDTTQTIDDKGAQKTIRNERSEIGTLQFLPERVELAAEPAPRPKRRGLYEVLTYETPIKVSGRFSFPAQFGYVPAEGKVSWGTPVLAFGISDPRGIKNSPALTWGDAKLRFQPGAAEQLTRIASGISAPLQGLLPEAPQDVDFLV